MDPGSESSTSGPVSYTHLDVYKRQSFLRKSGQRYTGRKTQNETFETDDACLRPPVSYTHLDVYKRQLPDWDRAVEAGIGNVAAAAMNQAFFTLSLGIAAIEIFGSYMSCLLYTSRCV